MLGLTLWSARLTAIGLCAKFLSAGSNPTCMLVPRLRDAHNCNTYTSIFSPTGGREAWRETHIERQFELLIAWPMLPLGDCEALCEALFQWSTKRDGEARCRSITLK